MKRRTNEVPRSSRGLQGEGPNWVLIAGGALLSTLSVRLGYKLKQVFDAKRPETSSNLLKGNGKSTDEKKSRNSHLHSNSCCFPRDGNGCHKCYSGSGNVVEIKQQCNSQIVTQPEIALPLVTVPACEFGKENGTIWASSPDRLELLQKPFHQSNSSDSPCVSESGSDIFSKREVIQKLRRQLKRRGDMILEMQDQITELQNSLSAQLSHSSHLQSLLDAANRDIFDSEREIRRLRKAIADHCVGHVNSTDNPPMVPVWPTGGRNGHSNGYLKVESNVESSENGRGDEGKIEMLRREVSELKEVVEGKEYLLQSYKEQKAELSEKIKELQQRLDSQLPHIFEKACLGDILHRYITADQFSPEYLLDYLDLSSEYTTLDIANRIESAVHFWRLKSQKKKLNRAKTGSWSGTVKGLGGDIEKSKLFANRADTLLTNLKLYFPGLPQTALDMNKIQFNKDVGQSILESYSRVMESLAFNLMARIDDLLYVDDATRRRRVASGGISMLSRRGSTGSHAFQKQKIVQGHSRSKTLVHH